MFDGSLVALATPFDAENAIDYPALEHLIDFHIEQGTDGLVIAGTTGESATLEQREHIELIRRAADYVGGRIPVIAGAGSNSTRQTADLSQAIADFAIDAYLLVVPYYNKPVQQGLYQHFWSVADAVDKPIMLYNVPGRTVADLMPETLGRLAEHPNIFAIKDATGDLQRLQENIAAVPEGFRHYSGDDITTLEFLKNGGHGVVTVSGNVAPALMSGMCRAIREKRLDDAESMDALLQPLNTALFLESNPIPVKWALHEMGLISAGIRLPLTVYNEKYHGQMRDAMAHAEVKTGREG